MTHIPTRVGGRFVMVILALSGSLPAFAQPADGTYRVISAKESRFQEELDRAVADGFRIVSGDAAIQLAVLERTGDATRRSYLFVRNVEGYLKDRKLPLGYRLVTSMFGGNQDLFHAVFERIEGDEQSRDYHLVKAGSAGGLRKRFEQGGEGSSGAIAIAAGPGAAAIYEARPDAHRATIVASGNTGTLQQELKDAGERGQCIADSDGIKEALYLLQDCVAGSGPRTYEVIAATKTETFEKELNDAAARGMRLVPASVVGIEKRMLMSAYNYETVGVVERVADRAPVRYRVIGVIRMPTLAKELQAAADAGFKLIAFGIGPKELVAVLEKR